MTNSGGFSTYSKEFIEEEKKFQALEKRLISEATILEGAVYYHFNADGSFAGISQGEPLPSTEAERAAARKKIEISETREIVEEVAPPPEKLNALQLESYVKLIQTNPPDPKWQKIIKDLKKQYPEQLGNIKEVDGDKLDADQFDTLIDNTSFYQKQVDVVLKNASLTTGMTFLTASTKVKSFAVKTENSLTNFLSAATQFEEGIFDLAGEIKSTAALIATGAQGMVNQLSNALSGAIVSGVQGGLSAIATTIFSSVPQYNVALNIVKRAQTALIAPVAAVFKGMNCLTSKVMNSLGGAIEDMLTAFVKNALNAPVCAVQQFVGAVLGKINSTIDKIVTPLTGGISKVLGPLFKVKDILGAGLNLSDKITDFFNCGDKNEDDSSSDKFEIDKVNSKKSRSEEEQQNFMDKATEAANSMNKGIENFGKNLTSGTEKKLTEFEKEYGQWTIFGSKVSEATDQNIGTDCYTGNKFKCGAPTGEIFGGDGEGGVGKVLLGKFFNKLDPDDIYGDIQRTASIIGFEITDPGSGYTQEPTIDFTDNCDQGYGAYGRVIIDKNVNSPTYGQITNVIIVSEGENYPVDLPAEVGDVFIKEIIVENGGVGYEDAFIDDDCMNLQVVDGKITGVEITCQKPYNSLPNINIVNEGIGAILHPIMSSTPTKTNTDQTVLQSVDCVGAYPKPGEY
tara:strand:- start:661 stop:2706 length:2046 start_codon:yes stop_codon:yes gene_type:complete